MRKPKENEETRMTAENRKGARHCGEIPPVWKEPGKSRECTAFPGPPRDHSRTELDRKAKGRKQKAGKGETRAGAPGDSWIRGRFSLGHRARGGLRHGKRPGPAASALQSVLFCLRVKRPSGNSLTASCSLLLFPFRIPQHPASVRPCSLWCSRVSALFPSALPLPSSAAFPSS